MLLRLASSSLFITAAKFVFQAEEICNRLLACLCERSICTKKMENGIAFFSLHNLVKQAIKLFIEEDDDELELIK